MRVLIGLQLVVPTIALALSPAPFGFQMYAGTGWTHVSVQGSDTRWREVLPTEYVATYRSEIDWTRGLPEHLCEQVPGVSRVRVTRWHEERVYTCP